MVCITFQVEEYFSRLPNIKVPKIGSTGEKYREQQLSMLLPFTHYILMNPVFIRLNPIVIYSW